MTTTVKIEAHCSDDKEVTIVIRDGLDIDIFTLQNCETAERYVYDAREISIKEVLK